MKLWYQSKTMLFNLATFIVTIAGIGLQYIDELGLTSAQAGMIGMALTMVVAVANIWLRKVTKLPIGNGK